MEGDQDLVRIPVAARRLGIGNSKAYELARTGQLPGVVRIGSMVRVSLRAVDRFIEEQTGASKTA